MHKLSFKVLEMLLDARDVMLVLPLLSNGKKFVRDVMKGKERGSNLIL